MRLVSLAVLAGALSVAAALLLAGESAAIRVDKDKDIAHPVVVNKVSPVYPEAAKKEGVQGSVIVEATVDTEGKVLDAKVAQGVDQRLDQAALDAVRQWTFKPARDKKGKAVKVVFTVTLKFALQ